MSFAGSPTACDGPMPCNGGPLKSGVNLMNDGVLDIDIPAVKVTGNVTLKGAALPDANVGRGSVEFALNDGTPATSKSFGNSGTGSYALTLLPGRYIVLYEGNPKQCDPTVLPSVPCMNQILSGCP